MDMTQICMKGEATEAMVGHMESMLGEMPSAPSMGNPVLALKDGAMETEDSIGKKKRASQKKERATGSVLDAEGADAEATGKRPKIIAEATLLEAMVSNPADYIRRWQKMSLLT